MKFEFENTPVNLLPEKGELYYYPETFDEKQSDLIYSQLEQEISWKQEPIIIFGKTVMQPRLTAWYADDGLTYTYSGITMPALSWTDTLQELKKKAELVCGQKFNSALLNFYRDGNDSMGWHRDNEKELGKDPAIASLSFGAKRNFKLRKYSNKKEQLSLELESGSLLFMHGETNLYWEHALPKTRKVNTGRINVTFRVVNVEGLFL